MSSYRNPFRPLAPQLIAQIQNRLDELEGRISGFGGTSGFGGGGAPSRSENLLYNAALDRWTDATHPNDWLSSAGANWNTGTNVNREATIVFALPYSAKLGDNSNTGRGMAQAAKFRVTATQTYAFGMRVRAPTGQTSEYIVVLKAFDSAGTEITTGTPLGPNWSYNALNGGWFISGTATDTWTLVQAGITLASNVWFLQCSIQYYQNGTGDKYIYVDETKLSRGQTTEPWALRPLFDDFTSPAGVIGDYDYFIYFDGVDFVCLNGRTQLSEYTGADPEVAIQTAFDALTNGGLVILQSQQDYTIISGLQVKYSKTILAGMGDSCRLVTTTSGVNPISATSLDDIVIRDFSIKCHTSGNGSGVFITGGDGVLVENVRVEDGWNGIFFYNGVKNSTIAGCHIYKSRQDGINLYVGCQRNVIEDNLVDGQNSPSTARHGIFLDGTTTGCDGNRVEHNHVYYTAGTGAAEAGHDGIIIFKSYNNIVSDNPVEYTRADGIVINEGGLNIVADNEINQPKLIGITMDGTSDSYGTFRNSAVGNQVNAAGTKGIYLTSKAQENEVISNLIYGCGQDGIYLRANSDDNNIIANKCQANGAYGIKIEDATCDWNRVQLNYLNGNSSGDAVNDGGTNTWLDWMLYNSTTTPAAAPANYWTRLYSRQDATASLKARLMEITSEATERVLVTAVATAPGRFGCGVFWAKESDWGTHPDSTTLAYSSSLLRNDSDQWIYNGVELNTGYMSGSGSVNKIPKFTGAAVLGDSIILDDGTTVSIARSAAPAFKVTDGGSGASHDVFAVNSSAKTFQIPNSGKIQLYDDAYSTEVLTIYGATGYMDCRGVFPYTTDTYYCGTDSKRWKGLYCTDGYATNAFHDGADHAWGDKTCPLCKQPFRKGQVLGLIVTKVTKKEIYTAPAHTPPCPAVRRRKRRRK